MLAPLLALTLALAAPRSAAPPPADTTDLRPGVAVLPFTNGGSIGGRAQELGPMEAGVQQMLMTEIAQSSALRMVERAALRPILEEQNLVTAGRVDAATAARVGKLVGAKFAITGAFMEVNGDFRIDARVLDVETGEIVRTEQVHGRRRNLYRMLVELAGRITRGVNLPPLPRPAAEARARRNVPDEATLMLSRALMYEDVGRRPEAIQLYRELVRRFPDYTEARDKLRKLGG